MAERVPRKIVINGGPSYEFHAVPSRRKRKAYSGQKGKTSSPLSVRKRTKNEMTYSMKSELNLSEEKDEAELPHSATKRILSDDIAYLQLLTTHTAATPVDEDYLAFALPDFDETNCSLKDEYFVVQRQVTKCPNGYIWLYGCSCNPARQRMLDVMSLEVSSAIDKDFDSPYQMCKHIQAMSELAAGFSESIGMSLEMEFEKRQESMKKQLHEHSYDKHSAKTDLYTVGGNSHAVCVRIEKFNEKPTYSIVKIDFRGKKPILKCSKCTKKSDVNTICEHTDAILSEGNGVSDISSEIKNLLTMKPKWRSRYVPTAISKKRIPFTVLPEEQKKNRSHFIKEQHSKDGVIHLFPGTNGSCSCGSEWSDAEFLEDVPVFIETDVLSARVYVQKCGSCENIKDYDGVEDQVLNMGSYMISHQILRRYLRQFVTEGTPLISFYQEMCWAQVESGNLEFSSQCTYSRFRYAWYSFLELLDINFASGFACPECGDTPCTVVMDGVSLGVRKAFIPWKDYLKRRGRAQILDGSSHNTRVFVNNATTRHLLNKFSLEGLSKTEYLQLKSFIVTYQPSLNEFFKEFDSVGENNLRCPELYCELFQCLASNYPVCAFLHYHERIFDILSEAASGKNLCDRVEDIILIEQECPVLSRLMHEWKWDVPIHMRPVLLELVQKAKQPFNGVQHNLDLCDDECECTGFGFFPTMSKQNHRGDYVLDNKSKNISSGSCRKKGPTHPTLIPGLFTVSCVHGICYGFQLMEDVESPNIPFTILRTRFHEAPKLIVYDNACNLHNYCLNRDPVFFRDSWFVVDRFHWCNHVGCHVGYNLSIYLQHREVNTQVAEQRNATLKKLKSMLSYMNIENFTNHLKLFMWFRSMINIIKLDQNIPLKDVSLFKSLLPTYSKLH